MEYSNKTNQELEQLIEQKDMDAACEMAQRCLEGSHGVEQNLNRAYQLFHRGESQGNRRAYEGLAYMYENGILFAQNLELARDYYTKAGVYKTEFAEEQVRVTNAERVAAAIAKAETPSTVKVDKFGSPSIPSQVRTVAAVQPTAPAPAPTAAPVRGNDLAALAAGKAQEAVQAARIAAQKAQEAAQAAQEAAEYAQKACC